MLTNRLITEIKKKIFLNLKSGITVSLVSIPMSVSLAVASGTSPVVGIITAVWAGLMASIFGGSNFNIVGPTGALSGILATFAIINGADTLPMLAVSSGIIILVAYTFKLHKYLVFVPGSTIQGFTLGVAFIIALNQLNYILGLTGLKSHEKFIDNVLESLSNISNTSYSDLTIFLISIVFLFYVSKVTKKVPGAIILSPLGIFLGFLSVNKIIPFTFITLGQKYATLSPTLFNMPRLFISPGLLTAAFTVALVAILETMISAKIADGMTKTKHSKQKEMFGLGVANIVSGLMGGIPATAALARTSLNIKTGATDKISATISSIFIIIISFFLLTYFKFIPMSVIGAILVFVAIKMVEIDHMKKMLIHDKTSFFVSLLVAFVTIYEDPIIGILFGTAVSLVFFMEKISKGQFELIISDKTKKPVMHVVDEDIREIALEQSHTLVYSMKGQLAYINCQSHLSRFENKLNGFQNIVFRFRELYFIDIDGIDVLDEICDFIHKNNRNIYFCGINPLIEKMLIESEWYRKLKTEGKVFNKTSDALKEIGFKI